MLKGKTAFITGSNRGLGRTVLEEFAKNGVDIIAHARKKTPDFKKTLEETAEKYGVRITPVYFDMTDTAKIKTCVQDLIRSRKQVDILVNNAGILSKGLFAATKIEDIKAVFDINFFSHLVLTQLILKIMCRNKSGSIVNIGSVGGLDAGMGNTAYAASKAALMTWTKTLGAEFGSFGIRANAVAPFLTQTDMENQFSENEREKMISHISLKRAARAEEIAKIVVFLASDESSFINGQIIRADGGVIL